MSETNILRCLLTVAGITLLGIGGFALATFDPYANEPIGTYALMFFGGIVSIGMSFMESL